MLDLVSLTPAQTNTTPNACGPYENADVFCARVGYASLPVKERELEVVHPAAKLLVMASQQQEAEMGDATNLVIVLAGELLKKAEELIRMGLKTSDIVLGYEKAQLAALQTLEGMLHVYLPETEQRLIQNRAGM